jgi:conjugal transfer ATP-binding protein TraC
MVNDTLDRIKQWKKERAERPKQMELTYGEQDPMDIISYAGMEEQPDYLCIDGRFARTLYITGYPLTAHSGWLDSLINFHHDIDISHHLQPVNAVTALPKLNRKITELESTRRSMIDKGQIIGPDVTDPLSSAMELRDKIQRGQERLFQVSIYITLTTNSLQELDKVTKLLETELSARMFFAVPARYQQPEALQSVLPRGENILNQKRNLDSSSAALTFPLTSSELVQESGILYGVNRANNTLVILDRFSLTNANSITFAQSGSGKSYTSKVEILRQLMQGTKVIVIDPEREYKQLTDSVGGTYIKLSAKSKEKINPFDLATTVHNKDDLAEHAQNLTEVIELLAEGLDKSEKAAVDKAILKVYADAKDEPPLLKALEGELHKMGELPLCKRLQKYITGTLTDNRLIVFDIKDMPSNLQPVMMVIVANFIQNTVKSKPEKRLLVIDEGWLLMEHEASARFITGMVRRARKYYLGVSLITQQAEDFLKSDYGRAIASQSALRILMHHDTTTIKRTVTEFGLSEEEERLLLTFGKGEAIIIADQYHAAVNILASQKEHPLITTNPAELYKP